MAHAVLKETQAERRALFLAQRHGTDSGASHENQEAHAAGFRIVLYLG